VKVKLLVGKISGRKSGGGKLEYNQIFIDTEFDSEFPKLLKVLLDL
jgi:hypothetical protein